MLGLCREFNEFNKQGKILNIDFIRRYVNYLTGIYDAKDYVSKVRTGILPQNIFASYAPELHRIVISLENIISGVENLESTRRKNFSKEQIEMLNVELIFAISHECIHAVQMMLIETYGNKTTASAIFSDCFDISVNNYDLYKKSYAYIPIEVNANILGKLMAVRFVNRLVSDKTAIENNTIIINEILDIITNSKNQVYSPTKRFYKIIKDQDRYEEIRSKDNLTDYQKLILGLPISNEYVSKLSSVGNKTKEIVKLKQYLKR